MTARIKHLTHKFVEFIPSEIQEGILYVSISYATASHKCCCGCGMEVVTPFSPTDWKLIFDGQSVSLNPSIGNWSFDCKSHYWLKNNRVIWAEAWSQERIDRVREHDRSTKNNYYKDQKEIVPVFETDSTLENLNLWQKFKKLLKF